MAFGQHSGPPASHKQLQYLESLVRKAGHADFRDARGPLGLTQRQAGGKFTAGEASALIDHLVSTDPDADAPIGRGGRSALPEPAPDRLDAERGRLLHGMPASLLAEELQRRGWTVQAP